jgi:hypothetical protein
MGLRQIYAQSVLIVFLFDQTSVCSTHFKSVADDAEAGPNLESLNPGMPWQGCRSWHEMDDREADGGGPMGSG